MRAPTARAMGGLVAIVVFGGAWLLVGDAVGYSPATIEATPSERPTGYGHRWRGAVHVHTRYSSDASGSIDEIARAAEEDGLDFVIVSDHTGAEGSSARHRDAWYGSVLVVSAEEISTTAGHLLALGNPAHRYAFGPGARQAVDDIIELGGAAIVAHPYGGEVAWEDAWAGIVGLEAVSYSAALYRMSWPRRLAALARYLVSPEAAALAVLAERAPALARWDALTRLHGNPSPHRLSALGAVDAHGPLRWLGVPGYGALMRSLTTSVWPGASPRPGETPRRQADAVRNAIIAGRAAVVVEAVGAAPGFDFRAEQGAGAGNAVPSGAVGAWAPGWTLRATMGGDGPYRIVLLADGEPVAESTAQPLAYAAARAATYRVEVYRTDGLRGAGASGFTPWVVSNPIYLWPADAIARSRRHRAPALPAPPPDTDLFSVAGWAAERGGAAMSAIARADLGLRWDLRVPDRDPRAEPYAAIAWRPEGGVDWRRSAGLSVRLHSQEPWRIAVRLELGNGETWERIVRSGPADRGAGIRWRDFRQLGADGHPVAGRELQAAAVASVRAVLLVVTPEIMKPHTETLVQVLSIGPYGSVP